MLDLLIRNAQIYDGSGAPAFMGRVGVEGGKIAFVRPGDGDEAAKETLDAGGLACTPGFIDSHDHADRNLAFYPEAVNFAAQGITTCVGGNCGSTLAPLPEGEYRNIIRKQRMLDQMGLDWHTFGDYLDVLDDHPSAVNFVPLVGHNALRGAVMGMDTDRAATPEELEKIKALLAEALDAGAFGMSTGTDPGMEGHCAAREEFIALCKMLEERGSFITAHTRHHQYQWPGDGKPYYGVFQDYPGELLCGRYHGLLEFVGWLREAPTLRAQIAHLTSAFPISQPHGQAMEDALVDDTLRQIIDEPRAEGLRLWFNSIPNNNSIGAIFPVTRDLLRSMQSNPFFRDYATRDKVLAALADESFREKYKKFINSGKFKFGMVCPGADPYWAEEFTFQQSADSGIVGKTLLEVTKERRPGTRTELIYNNCLDELFAILARDPDTMWAQTLDRREYMAWERLLTHPCGMPCTDIIAFPENVADAVDNMGYGKPPAVYTMFIRYLVRMVREKKFLTLSEAVRRLTSLPAELLEIEGRGRLKAGMFADICLFDIDALSYEDDYLHPDKRAKGLEHVLVNGCFVLRGGELTKARPGKILRKQY